MEKKSFKKLQEYILDFIRAKNGEELHYLLSCENAIKFKVLLLALGQKPILINLSTDECELKVIKNL